MADLAALERAILRVIPREGWRHVLADDARYLSLCLRHYCEHVRQEYWRIVYG